MLYSNCSNTRRKVEDTRSRPVDRESRFAGTLDPTSCFGGNRVPTAMKFCHANSPRD